MKLAVITEALAALRAIKDSAGASVPTELWRAAMYAHNRLEAALEEEALAVKVTPPSPSTEENARAEASLAAAMARFERIGPR